MINAIHHVAISTGDMERSLRFYRDLLGLEVGWELGRSVKTTYGRDPDGNVVELQEILWKGSRLALR